LQCETVLSGENPGLMKKIQSSIREICKLRAEVELVAPGLLANDGKVIDDLRPID